MRSALSTPYERRHFASIGIWQAGGLALKACSIVLAGAARPDERLVQDAVSYAQRVLPGAVLARAHVGAGFAVLHVGSEATWLLLGWWTEGAVCCQLLARSAGPCEPFLPVADSLLACVWELVVIGHERAAYVATMLVAEPDLEAYLRAALPDGAY